MTNENKLSLPEINRLRTTEKVKIALDKMSKSKLPITIKTVSETAKISRKTIYNRPDLKSLLEEYQSLQNDLNNPGRSQGKRKGSTQAEQINHLRKKNKVLIEDKKKILEQNMLLTNEIIKLKNRLCDLEDKLYSQSVVKVIRTK